MVEYRYNFPEDKLPKKHVKAMLVNAKVSRKYSVEMAKYIKGMKIPEARRFLQDIIEKKRYLPITRYNRDLPHRRNTGGMKVVTGRYPVNVAKAFLKLLDNLENNAISKGLEPERIKIIHVQANKGIPRYRVKTKGNVHIREFSGAPAMRLVVKSKATHIQMIGVEV